MAYALVFLLPIPEEKMYSRTQIVMEFERMIEERGPFDLWFTATFRRETQIGSAKRKFKSFFKHLNTPEGWFFDNHVFCFVCFEKDSRGGVHIHALIRGIHALLASELQEKCEKQFGISKIVGYMPSKDAALYLASKYVNPDLVDFGFMKINSRIRRRSQTGFSRRIKL